MHFLIIRIHCKNTKFLVFSKFFPKFMTLSISIFSSFFLFNHNINFLQLTNNIDSLFSTNFFNKGDLLVYSSTFYESVEYKNGVNYVSNSSFGGVESLVDGVVIKIEKANNFYSVYIQDIFTNLRKNMLYNKKIVYENLDEEYRTTLINFAKYKLVMFAMAKLMEMETTEQNKVALYLFNHIKI